MQENQQWYAAKQSDYLSMKQRFLRERLEAESSGTSSERSQGNQKPSAAGQEQSQVTELGKGNAGERLGVRNQDK